MSMFCSDAVTVRAARKTHRCTWCGERIEPGSSYKHWATGGDGESPFRNKVHPECDEALSLAMNQEGGWFEYEPGSFKRGSTEDR